MALSAEHGYASYTLSNHVDAPQRTPARGLSRRSSRYESSSPVISSSPPPLPVTGEDSYFFGKQNDDASKNEKISVLDPRRFTPTLHASLVSEILSLRREVESKNSVVGNLEESLQSARNETDRLNDTITSNAKEHRSMKLQIETLEAGTLSALEELAKERDRTAENLADTRRRLEVSQKKIRNQEEEAKQLHGVWDRDRQGWDSEKRLLARRVHAAEERAKLIIAEFAAAREEEQNRRDAEKSSEWRREDHGDRSETSMSNGTRQGRGSSDGRTSSMSGRYGFSSKVAGISLAEELEFEKDDEDIEEVGYAMECASPEELPEEAAQRMRPQSAQSHHQSSKAMRVLGLFKEDERSSLEEEPLRMADASRHAAVKIMDIVQEAPDTDSQYIDSGTQFSPPTSPELRAQQAHDDFSDRTIAFSDCVSTETISSFHQDSKPYLTSISKGSSPMVSQACQTLEHPPSPPDTPKTCDASTFVMDDVADPVDRSTQTDSRGLEPTPPATTREAQALSLDVPVIAIHPPITGSTSDRHSVVLPPQTKNAVCQVDIRLPISLRSVSVQTEEIRVDRRPIKLPSHLLPSAISSQPPSPSPELQKTTKPSIGEAPRRKAPSPPIPIGIAHVKGPVDSEATGTAKDSYPGRNDNGPLKASNETHIKRPVRSGSLFAGFDDEANDAINTGKGETDYSDDDFVNAEPIRKTLSKVQNSWKLVPQTTDSVLDRLESHKLAKDLTPLSEFEPIDNQPETRKKKDIPAGKAENISRSAAVSRKENIRKAALISNGIAVHKQRERSPSAPTTSSNAAVNAPTPPFPVPTRLSSKKKLVSSSDGAQSPTPKSTGYSSRNRMKENGRPTANRPALRKMRSEVTPKSRNGRGSRSPSPPLISPSFSIPESPPLPPLLVKGEANFSNITTHQIPKHRQSKSYASIYMDEIVPETAVQQTSVVDATAQTMVGEWMWKYVRRRKSFGIPESPQAEFESGKNSGDNGSRHKRWVWLAPYDRAVMWSTKQPTSGPALMGKSGRKLTIQSVLDVKDDTPIPKGSPSNTLFGRSILILTPQRALKFTATTRERHYIWLTALSFLSHSSLAVSDLTALPPVPTQEYRPPPHQKATTSLRRNPIRDSIRVAKGKPRPMFNRGSQSYTASAGTGIRQSTTFPSLPTTAVFDEEVEEGAAEPPNIPRTAAHTRKRSNTGPLPILPQFSTFRSFSTTAMPSRESFRTAKSGSTDAFSSTGHAASIYEGDFGASVNSSHAVPAINFFDAVGTVRMEAFVDQSLRQSLPRSQTYAHSTMEPFPSPMMDARGRSRVDSLKEAIPTHILHEEEPLRDGYKPKQGKRKGLEYMNLGRENGEGEEDDDDDYDEGIKEGKSRQ